MNDGPIGLFDSGIGGFSILKEIKNHLPFEDIIFLSDNARHPYGSKSEERIRNISFENANFLSNLGSKMIVIACNTASAIAKKQLEIGMNKIIVGVIDAGVRAAIQKTKTGKIGIIGTKQTINTKIHEKTIKSLRPNFKVFSKATPLFAPIVEEGYINSKSTSFLIEEELSFFKNKDVDVLILGCTHYPFLQTKIQKYLGKNVTLIDPAKETAIEIKNILTNNFLISTNNLGSTTIYFSDPSSISNISQKTGYILKPITIEEISSKVVMS